MHIVKPLKKSLKTLCDRLFSGWTAGTASDAAGLRPKVNQADTGGLERRCVNPDTGCRFEGA
jgi:hypothetical protein